MLRDGITGDWSVSSFLLETLFADIEAGSALSWAIKALCGKLDFQQMQQLRQPLRQISLRMWKVSLVRKHLKSLLCLL